MQKTSWHVLIATSVLALSTVLVIGLVLSTRVPAAVSPSPVADNRAQAPALLQGDQSVQSAAVDVAPPPHAQPPAAAQTATDEQWQLECPLLEFAHQVLTADGVTRIQFTPLDLTGRAAAWRLRSVHVIPVVGHGGALDRVFAHFRINEGELYSVKMAYSQSRHAGGMVGFEQGRIALDDEDVLSYWFTYRVFGVECDSRMFAYTHSVQNTHAEYVPFGQVGHT